MNRQQKMNDSTDLRNRILQMREANNLNLVTEKSEYVDEKVIPKERIIPENNVINNKENVKSSVMNEMLTQETDNKDQSLLNKKKSLDNETLSNNSNKENGYLIEYFDHASNSKDPIHVEYGTGSKFWVFEGFAKEIIAKQERPDIYVKFTCTYVPDISGFHDFELFAIGKSKLLIDDKLIVDNWSKVEQGDAFFAFASSPVKGGTDLKKNQEHRI